MPASVQNAIPMAVMPAFLSRQFTASREILVLENVYRDGERQIKNTVSTSRKLFEIAAIMPATVLTPMRSFYVARKGGTEAFFFYYGPECGYTHDASGLSSDGRYTVVFESIWQQIVGVARSQAQIRLREVD